MNFDVFISYHTKSSAHITEAVCNALENKKIKDNFCNTDKWLKDIKNNIDNCKKKML